jgi:hypothetical protein
MLRGHFKHKSNSTLGNSRRKIVNQVWFDMPVSIERLWIRGGKKVRGLFQMRSFVWTENELKVAKGDLNASCPGHRLLCN